MNPQYIISSPRSLAGLSNRIKCLISCLCMADREEMTLLVHWTKSSMFNCEFNDLFKNRFIQTYKSDFQIHKLNEKFDNYFLVETWRLVTNSNSYKDSKGEESPKTKSLDFQYNKLTLKEKNILLPYFESLTPVNEILDITQSFSEQFSNSTASIAIRTWKDAPSREHLFEIEKIYQIFENNQSQEFFVSCDSIEVINILKDKYGSQLCYYPKRTHHGDRNSPEGIQDALVDILLLAKNSTLFASGHSTFSEVAWWMGGAKATVHII